MSPRIGRTLPPAAAPFSFREVASGLAALVSGEKAVARFEEELRRAFGARHCLAVSSGQVAFFLILRALRELAPERDEVLVPAYTCYSVPAAIVRAGLRVRLCDPAPGSLDFDFERLEQELRHPRLLCVVPTHLFGIPADVARVKSLAAPHGVFVVEDAAQAMGETSPAGHLGTIGDAGFFSLGRGKALSTVSGGIILTGSDRIDDTLRRQRHLLEKWDFRDVAVLFLYAAALCVFIHPRLFWLPRALPFLKLGETRFDPRFALRRLSPFQAGMAAGWQQRLEKMRGVRRANAAAIAAGGVAAAAPVADAAPLRFPVLLPGAREKGLVLAAATEQGLGIADGYPDTLAGIPELQGTGVEGTFSAAQEAARRLVTLPVHPFVRPADILRMTRLVLAHGEVSDVG